MRRIPAHRRQGLCCRLILLGLLALPPQIAPAASPSTLMSQAMLIMMDALGDLAHRYKNRSNRTFGSGYTPYGSLYGLAGPALHPYSPAWQAPLPDPYGTTAPPPPGASPVDGIWLGAGGEIVLVMYGHFRVYASTDVYRDGLFAITGDRLVMYDPRSGYRGVFDYYFEDGRMFLRGDRGGVMAFKQLPIPIPPYAVFTNPQPALR